MDLKHLFDLQQVDLLIDQARHALDHLNERSEHGLRVRDLESVRASRDAVRREQNQQESELLAIESESADIDRHMVRLEAQLKTIIAPREAEALQHEIANLADKRNTLDDRGLALLEDSSRAEEALIGLLEQEELAVRAEERARSEMDKAIAAMEGEIARLLERRLETASGIPAADIGEYERRRKEFGGIAVAEVNKGVCGGCHMDISISELDAIKRLPLDALAECPNCNRLLVR